VGGLLVIRFVVLWITVRRDRFVVSILVVVESAELVHAVLVEEVAVRVHKGAILVDVKSIFVVHSSRGIPLSHTLLLVVRVLMLTRVGLLMLLLVKSLLRWIGRVAWMRMRVPVRVRMRVRVRMVDS
jgi:hypothetical protein